MPDMIHNIVYQFAKQLREIYGDELKKVVVYGSYARGDFRSDSDVDIMTAKNSGLECISVTWGFRDEEFLLEHGATQIIHKPEELLEFF